MKSNGYLYLAIIIVAMYLAGVYTGCSVRKPAEERVVTVTEVVEVYYPDTVYVLQKGTVKYKTVVEVDTLLLPPVRDSFYVVVPGDTYQEVTRHVYESKYSKGFVNDTIDIYEGDIVYKGQAMSLYVVEEQPKKEAKYNQLHFGVLSTSNLETANVYIGANYTSPQNFQIGLYKSLLDKSVAVNSKIPVFKWLQKNR